MKGQLLPKELRIKGKSKFFYKRLKEEGIIFGDIPWLGIIQENPMMKLRKKVLGK